MTCTFGTVHRDDTRLYTVFLGNGCHLHRLIVGVVHAALHVPFVFCTQHARYYMVTGTCSVYYVEMEYIRFVARI